MQLSGKTALVTGGSRGIGAAVARRLAAEGADVAITFAGDAAAAEEVVHAIEAAGHRGHALRADAAEPRAQQDAVGRAIDLLGGLDILVYSAGVGGPATVDKDTMENFDHVFGVNVGGVFAGTIAAVTRMNDGGRIVVIGSINGHTVPWSGAGVYAASKAALGGLVRGWARDLAPRGILVNVVNPGPTDTDKNPDDASARARRFIDWTALGRYGRPEEIAGAVAFLVGPDASFITGVALDVDGGASI